jgi:hypothetical protein
MASVFTVPRATSRWNHDDPHWKTDCLQRIPDMNGRLREYLINGALILVVLLAVLGFVHFFGLAN